MFRRIARWLRRPKPEPYSKVHHAPSVGVGRVGVRKIGKLTLDPKGIDEIIFSEVSSESAYKRIYHRPVWPGGASGVTVGIGFDLGYNSANEISDAWADRISVSRPELQLLRECSNIRGSRAKAKKNAIASKISISWEDAQETFYSVTLPRFVRSTANAFPGVENLHPLAQAVLVSLVYNRGPSLKAGDRRREMRQIRDAVPNQDYTAIAAALVSMKRLWVGKGLEGLLKRRDREAKLIREAEKLA